MKSEYTKKAEQLMKTLNITYTIEYDGIGINPNRNDKDKRTMYSVHLENSRGFMDFTFWGSMLEAELRKMSMDDYCRIYMRSCYQDLSYADKRKANRAYQKKLKEYKVDIYDVVAALQNTKLALSQISVINMDMMRTVAEQKGYISPVQMNIISSRRCLQKKKWKC